MIKKISKISFAGLLKTSNIVSLKHLGVKFYSWLVDKYYLVKKNSYKIINLKELLSKIIKFDFIFRLKNWIAIILASLSIFKKLLAIALFDLTKDPKVINPIINDKEPIHWLLKTKTIHKLWIGSSLILVFLILLESLIEQKSYFSLDSIFAFNAWYGFLVCILMVLIAKGLGVFLKRQDNYYERD